MNLHSIATPHRPLTDDQRRALAYVLAHFGDARCEILPKSIRIAYYQDNLLSTLDTEDTRYWATQWRECRGGWCQNGKTASHEFNPDDHRIKWLDA